MENQTNVIRYDLKKMMKAVSSEQPIDKRWFLSALRDVEDYFIGRKFKALASDCFKVRKQLLSEMFDILTVNRLLGAMLLAVKHIKEKTQVMTTRKLKAEYNWKNSFHSMDLKHKDTLHPFDVVFVPTQGGFHYAVIFKVEQGYATCYPLTSSNTHGLQMLGCGYCILKECDIARFNGAKLTSTKEVYEVEELKDSYYCHLSNEREIRAGIEKF